MSNDFCANTIKPPTDRQIWVLIINDLGVCDMEWHCVYFDSSLEGGELDIFDDQGKYVGKVWRWKEFTDV